MKCSEEGCEEESRSRGMCNSHYGKWHRENLRFSPVDGSGKIRPLCDVGSCAEIAYAKGLCSKHYSKEWNQENKERVLEESRTPWSRFLMAQRAAKRRGVDWKLTFEKYAPYCPMPCHYCSNNFGEVGVGLDRIDNNKGYEEGNILPCCGNCNKLRSNRITVAEMVELVNLLKELRGGVVWTESMALRRAQNREAYRDLGYYDDVEDENEEVDEIINDPDIQPDEPPDAPT